MQLWCATVSYTHLTTGSKNLVEGTVAAGKQVILEAKSVTTAVYSLCLLYTSSGGQNVWAGTLEKAWHGEGTGNDIPRLSSNDLNLNYNRVSSFYVEDGSYLRCKLLQIGYTLPKKWVGGADLRLSFSAQKDVYKRQGIEYGEKDDKGQQDIE